MSNDETDIYGLTPEQLIKARENWKALGLEGHTKNHAFDHLEVNVPFEHDQKPVAETNPTPREDQ